MRLVIALVASSVLLFGCGGSAEPDAESSSSKPESSVPPEAGLEDLCPRLVAAANLDDSADLSTLEAAETELDAIAAEGDASVDAAVEAVRPGIEANLEYARAGSPAGEGLAAFEGLTEARMAAATACP